MNTLREIVAPHRPDFRSPEIDVASTRNGSNYNSEADHAAILAAPIDSLPPSLARERAELEERKAQVDEQEARVRAKVDRIRELECLVSDIAGRKNTLAGEVGRLNSSRDLLATAGDKLKAAIAGEKNTFYPETPGLLSAIVVARELVNLMPAIIAAEQKEIEKLESAAAKLARECGLH